MAVLRVDNGVLAPLHDAFSVPHAGIGIEIHGSIGALIGRHVMTQRPVGEVLLRDAGGERVVPVVHRDLHEASVAAFGAAQSRAAAHPQPAVRTACDRWPPHSP